MDGKVGAVWLVGMAAPVGVSGPALSDNKEACSTSGSMVI